MPTGGISKPVAPGMPTGGFVPPGQGATPTYSYDVPPPTFPGGGVAPGMPTGGFIPQAPPKKGVPPGTPPATTNSAGQQVDVDPGLSNTQGGDLGQYGETGGFSGDAATPSGGAQPGGAPVVKQYQDLMGQIQSSQDPQQQAVLKDQLARKVFVSLKTAGHDVKWDGDQLMIDGRPYVVGEGTGAAAGGIAPGDAPNAGTAPPLEPGSGDPNMPDVPGPTPYKGTQPQTGSTAAPGTYRTKLLEGDVNKLKDPAHAAESPKYDFLQLAQQNKYDYNQLPQMLEELKAGPNGKHWQGWVAEKGDLVYKGDPSQLGPEWGGVTSVDAVGGYGADGSTASGWRWGADDAGTRGNPNATTNTAPGVDTAPGIYNNGQAAGAAGVQLGGDDPFAASGGGTYFPASGGWVPNNNPGAIAAARAAEAAGPAGGGGGAGAGGWNPTAPTYTPGAMDNSDLEGYSLDELLGRLGGGTNPGQLATDYQAGQIPNDPLNLGRVDEDYQDGRVSDDALSTYSYDGQQDLGELGAGRTQQETEDLVSRILANPESMDPRTVEMLKAASKDELADQQNQEDDDLTAAGYATGNADSNWLQSEKLASAGRRDQALVGSNRAVDMKAAETNAADRKSAAALGQGFAESKALTARADAAEKLAQQQANEGNLQAAAASRAQAQQYHRQAETINEQLRSEAFKTRQGASEINAGRTTAEAKFGREGALANESIRGEAADRNLKASQQNIENQFRSTAERQSAFKLAADTSLAAAAQKGDRMAFEEQIKQRATELGQSADKIRQDYVLGLLHEATSKYGIDVGADLDRAKLAQAGTEFQQDLAFRLRALAQADRQFGASYGLEHARTQAGIDQQEYSRYADTFL
jgi:hypothetical protein